MSTVTCHTAGCENAGVAIEMTLTYIDEETGETVVVSGVACGPCGQPITDIQPPLEQTREETPHG